MLKQAALAFPPLRRLYEDRRHLRDELQRLQETKNSPFWFYNAAFDAQAVMRRYAAPDPSPTPGYLTNFLGVRIDPKFFPTILTGRGGTVEALPLPANWHADIAEWGAALRAVDLAQSSFRAAELGCGWGCWLNNTGVAARRAGLVVELIGVEGDADHVAFAHEAMATNGFDPRQYRIVHGICAARSGTALFPKNAGEGGHDWGLEPILDASHQEVAEADGSGRYEALPQVPLSDLADGRRLDLLHVDIQGGEAALLRDSLATLDALVAYVVVGTHGRSIEGQIIDLLLGAGWILEIERPCIFAIEGGKPRLSVDGVQGWRNPRLLPP